MSFRNVPLGGDAGQPSASERRATVRYHCAPATTGRVVLSPKQEMQKGWILDVSRQGVGLLLTRPLPVGQTVVIRMTATTGGNVHNLAACVVHATQQTGGEWFVGCLLDTPLTPDVLDALL